MCRRRRRRRRAYTPSCSPRLGTIERIRLVFEATTIHAAAFRGGSRSLVLARPRAVGISRVLGSFPPPNNTDYETASSSSSSDIFESRNMVDEGTKLGRFIGE